MSAIHMRFVLTRMVGTRVNVLMDSKVMVNIVKILMNVLKKPMIVILSPEFVLIMLARLFVNVSMDTS